MPAVTIDEDIYSYLQQQAVPLEDDVNSVLRRELGLHKDTLQMLLPQEHYAPAILRALLEMGGEGVKAKVFDRVGEILKHRHSDFDLEKYASGEVRWRHRAGDERKNLLDRGLIEPDAGYGVWKLTDAGWAEARKATSEEI